MEKHWTEQALLKDKYCRCKLKFLKMREKRQSIWDGYLGYVSAAWRYLILSLPEVVSIHTAFFQTGPLQRVLVKEKVDKMVKVEATEFATIE